MKNHLHILLVEDEAIVAMQMQMELKRIGCQITAHVTTGENAIIAARQNPPDVILMDIRLAGEIDGIEAAAIIKPAYKGKFIFITGYNDKDMNERAQKLDPIAYLIKPLNICEFESIIETNFS